MSRLGKIPIAIPKGVDVALEGQKVTVKGPKGLLQLEMKPGVFVSVKDGQVHLEIRESTKEVKSLHGLYWALIRNMVLGVTQGFEKKLELIGVGYRAAVVGQALDLQLGLSHPTRVPIPLDIKVAVEKNTLVTLTGIDNRKVGQLAADIRALKKPEPYKGKGIRYVGEYVRSKAGKSGKKA